MRQRSEAMREIRLQDRVARRRVPHIEHTKPSSQEDAHTAHTIGAGGWPERWGAGGRCSELFARGWCLRVCAGARGASQASAEIVQYFLIDFKIFALCKYELCVFF